MLSCRAVQKNLTAWIDGALSHRRAERLQRHLGTCAACTAEAASLRRAVDTQQASLAALTTVNDLESGRLWLELRQALREPVKTETGTWNLLRDWVFHPVTLAGGALATAVILAFVLAGGPAAVLIPLGVEAPPVAVQANPELFKDYPLIQHLDVLENFDTVQSVPLDEDQSGQG